MSDDKVLQPQLYIRTDYPNQAVRAISDDHPTGLNAFGHIRVYFVYADPDEKSGFSFFRDYDYNRTAGQYAYHGLVFKCQVDEHNEYPYAEGIYIEDEVQLPEAARLVRTMKMIDRKVTRWGDRWGHPLTIPTRVQYIANGIGATTIYQRAIDEERSSFMQNPTFYARDKVDCGAVVRDAIQRVQRACRMMARMPEINP